MTKWIVELLILVSKEIVMDHCGRVVFCGGRYIGEGGELGRGE